MTLSRTQEAPLVGDRVLYRKAFGHGTQVEATVTGLGDEAGTPVVDVVLDNGKRHWGYLDQIEARVADALEVQINAGARRMLKEPWRIARALNPFAPSIWPIEGKLPQELLAECESRIATVKANAAVGHWSYDTNRMVALRQAKRALKAMIFEASQPNTAGRE